MATQEDSELFELEMELRKGQGDPTRAFKAMTGLIEAIQSLDNHLAHAISSTVETQILLHDIQVGSLRAILRTVIISIPEEPLKEGNVRAVIGQYLRKARHKVLDWCVGRNEIRSREEVQALESDVFQLGKMTDVKMIPAYSPVPAVTLLSDIRKVGDALGNLQEGDSASLFSDQGKSFFNKDLMVSMDEVNKVITRETLVSEAERIVKVKKPDYLGSSKWMVKYGTHLIEAKILDNEWLSQFQGRDVILQPQDSLRVLMREEVSYGYDNEVVCTNYAIVKVVKLIPALKWEQTNLFEM
jgi:hypothetical protein